MAKHEVHHSPFSVHPFNLIFRKRPRRHQLAAELVAAGHVVYHPGGGTHHGLPDRANGFCYFNDPVLARVRERMPRIGIYDEPHWAVVPANTLLAQKMQDWPPLLPTACCRLRCCWQQCLRPRVCSACLSGA